METGAGHWDETGPGRSMGQIPVWSLCDGAPQASGLGPVLLP